MRKDTFTIGAVAGIIGTIIMLVLSLIFGALGLLEITVLEISAAFFLEEDQVNTVAGMIVGAVAFFITGAGGGVLLAYFIKVSGKDYYWLKGLALAGFNIVLIMGFAVGLLDIAPQMHGDSTTMLIHVIEIMAYGLVTAYIINIYGEFRLEEC